MEQSLSDSAAADDWRLRKTWFTRRTLFSKITVAALKVYYFPQIKLERVGFENLPDGPCILAANHINNDDAPIMAIALPNHRYPYFMAKKELFLKAEWVYRHLGAFPVYRGEFDNWAFEYAGKILAAGHVCGIYAEGSRKGRGKVELRKAKTGAVRLALHFKAPIVPCALIGPEELYVKRFKGWRPVTVKMSIGQPIDVAALAPPEPYTKKTYHALTTIVMKALAALLPEEHRGYYA